LTNGGKSTRIKPQVFRAPSAFVRTKLGCDKPTKHAAGPRKQNFRFEQRFRNETAREFSLRHCIRSHPTLSSARVSEYVFLPAQGPAKGNATMPDHRTEQGLALRGGLKAVSGIEGRGQPKIGVDEFMSVVERFGLSEDALGGIRKIAEAHDWGGGPFLANYYSGLAESKVQAFERRGREIFGSAYALGVIRGRQPCTVLSSPPGSVRAGK